jgi:hypothetical protein
MPLISDRGPAGELIRRGYGLPVVFERLEFRDQGSFGWRSINEVELSWSHASVFLHQLRPHVQNERDAHCLAMMLESVESEGKLPAAMDEVLQPVKP